MQSASAPLYNYPTAMHPDPPYDVQTSILLKQCLNMKRSSWCLRVLLRAFGAVVAANSGPALAWNAHKGPK